jgi:hypothetical protein
MNSALPLGCPGGARCIRGGISLPCSYPRRTGAINSTGVAALSRQRREVRRLGLLLSLTTT